MKTFYLHNKCRKQWGNKNGNNPTGGLDIFVGITSGSTKLDQMLECFPMYLNKIGQFLIFELHQNLMAQIMVCWMLFFEYCIFFWCCTGCSVAVHCWILRPMSFAVRGVLPRDIRHIVPHRATSCHIVPYALYVLHDLSNHQFLANWSHWSHGSMWSMPVFAGKVWGSVIAKKHHKFAKNHRAKKNQASPWNTT